ncbi:acetate--CoA ligase [Pseudomonas sp. HR96]|uniref:acetate--CoA ligase n=1 Tax=Pseudomonas sp. HR96 TaxID=1027966 RepID=UPI002A75B3AE|nr:acetate--CoA ligase [Pseudomonas sp. HR96]WPP00601.1 acetate--CoA ligase [Pseudomonas sp. HR96]
MLDISAYPVADKVSLAAVPSEVDYQRLYRQSIDDPQTFWAEQAHACLEWTRPWTQVHRFDPASGQASWFQGGQLNASHNCIDRHLAERAEQAALLWEGDDPEESLTVTYRQLHRHVCRLANVLKARGVGKGHRVCIYMPMVPEAVYAILACSRLGAVHSVVFGGFSADALRDRILDADCHTVITADESVRAGKHVGLKHHVDQALLACPQVSTVLVVERTGGRINWVAGRDYWYHEAIRLAPEDCPAEPMQAEDPLFILYTSGSTGKPKGVVHSTGGYLLQTALSFKTVFDYRPGEVFWCTADIGWITGQSYIVYGPLANGATTLIYEGVPDHPSAERYWQIVDKRQVNILYTAPTVLRALMREGPRFLQETARTSLRLLGSVGEPINSEAWEWYFNAVGQQRCPIVDTWWQTETGAIMLSPRVAARQLKPGCAMQPCYGVQPVLLNEQGEEIHGPGTGILVLKGSWPAQLRTIHGNPQRMTETYYQPYPGYYFTGDGARRDEDGDLWITGRIDDVINVSAQRIGTAEIESALLLHPNIAEAAVVGCPHPLKGQAIYAYVTPMSGVTADEDLHQELLTLVSQEIGRFARPEWLQFTSTLPKTRSGKIMRRILRKIASNELDSLGDTSTLADPDVVRELIEERLNR